MPTVSLDAMAIAGKIDHPFDCEAVNGSIQSGDTRSLLIDGISRVGGMFFFKQEIVEKQ